MQIRPNRLVIAAALMAIANSSWAGMPYPNRQSPAPKDLGTLAAQGATSDITVTLALKLQHAEAAGQLLEALSNTKSPKYHQFLTPAQFKTQFGASDQDIATLSAQLAVYGLSAARAGASVLRVSGSAANFERTFQVSLHRYTVAAHGRSESFEFRAPAAAPKIPAEMSAVVAGIVFVQEGQRRIPVQYAKRVIGRRMSEGGQTYLPLRVNMAGVIPVIFAASIMAFPPTVGQLVKTHWGQQISDFFTPNGWHYVVGESLFIIIFTYFYTAVTFNPVDQADNLKKYGGFIPGVRPGRPTAEFLDRVLARLTFPGALFLAAVAALPTILIARTHQNIPLGGTSILIVIGVALETMKQLEAQLMMRSYEGFLK